MFKTTYLVKLAKNKELGKDRLWSSLVSNGVICAWCYEAFYGRSNVTPLSVAWLYACNYAARWLCWREIRPYKCFITLATEFMAVSHALRPLKALQHQAMNDRTTGAEPATSYKFLKKHQVCFFVHQLTTGRTFYPSSLSRSAEIRFGDSVFFPGTSGSAAKISFEQLLPKKK